MEIRNNSNTSFQAKVSKPVKDYIKNEALNYGGKTMQAVRNKISEIESWGSKDSFVDLNFYDRTSNTISFDKPFGLVLSNPLAKLPDEVALSAGKKTLYQNFMALREKDVVTAEQQLSANTAPKSIDLFA